MTPAERAALRDIRGFAAAGQVSLTAHARTRMIERRVKPGDVRSALVSAVTCTGQVGGTWKVAGPDLDGDHLDLVVVLDDGVLVVTVF